MPGHPFACRSPAGCDTTVAGVATPGRRRLIAFEPAHAPTSRSASGALPSSLASGSAGGLIRHDNRFARDVYANCGINTALRCGMDLLNFRRFRRRRRRISATHAPKRSAAPSPPTDDPRRHRPASPSETAAAPEAPVGVGSAVLAIVTRFGEPDVAITRTLRALVRQSRPPEQLVLVDDASPVPPRLPEDLRERVRLLALVANSGLSAARNAGASLRDSEYLLFVNCDVLLAENWIRLALEFMDEHPEAGAAGGAIVPRRGRPAIRRWRLQHIETRVHRVPPCAPTKVRWIVGHAMCIPRSAFERVGGFDERYRRAAEDADLCARLAACGLAVYHLPQLCAESHEPATIDGMARKAVRNSGWNIHPSCAPCQAVRPLAPMRAALCTMRMLAACTVRDLLKGRWGLLAVDLAVALRAVALIGQAWRRQRAQ